MNAIKTNPVERTTVGLVSACFDALDDLRSNRIDAEQARAISHTCRTIVSVARMEMDYMQLNDKMTAVPGELKSLPMKVGE